MRKEEKKRRGEEEWKRRVEREIEEWNRRVETKSGIEEWNRRDTLVTFDSFALTNSIYLHIPSNRSSSTRQHGAATR